MFSLPPALVFDLDGTLVDTAPDLTAVLNWVLEREGHAAVAESEVRHMVGRGARHLITQALLAAAKTPSEAELTRLFNDFIAYYGAHVADRSVVFEGVVDVLDICRQHGVRMGVCTNKPEGLSYQLLEALNLRSYFSTILGGDSLPVRKPDPAHLLKTMEAMGVGPRDTIMVGDSISDISAARGAGVPVVGVSFGYTDTPIAELNPDIIIDRFADLPQALARILSGVSSA